MSVLNKMLRDLEQRQHNPALAGEDSIVAMSERSRWQGLLKWLSLPLLLLAIYLLLTRTPVASSGGEGNPVNSRAVVSPVSIVTESHSRAETIAETHLNKTTPTEATAESVPAEHNSIAASYHDVQGISTSSELAALHNTSAQVHSEPLQVSTTASVPLTAFAKATQLSVVTEPALVAAVEPTAEPAAKMQLQRTTVSKQQQRDALRQQAVTATHAGQLSQAVHYWQQLQRLTPDDADVYTEQARLLLQLGQQAEATHVLQQALQRDIATATMQLLLAQQAAVAGQWQQVDSLLSADLPVAGQPDYFGLKATALQQLGQHQAALHWYSQLIKLQPQQARWWLGAAISLDAQALSEQAHVHYRQALHWGDSLSVSSRNYIQQRLAATE